MRHRPEKGLIVSCYLESMCGCEFEFIAAVAHLPGVVGLRVEGLENIRYARRIAPEKFIVGLVKVRERGEIRITPNILDAYEVKDVGADMVAMEFLSELVCAGDIPTTEHGLQIPFSVMMDIDTERYEAYFCTSLPGRPTNCKVALRQGLRNETIVLATTFEDRAFDLVERIKKDMPFALVNLEGGIKTAADIQRGFDCGADWVTIGKAINDPPTIIESLVEKSKIRKAAKRIQTRSYVDGINLFTNDIE